MNYLAFSTEFKIRLSDLPIEQTQKASNQEWICSLLITSLTEFKRSLEGVDAQNVSSICDILFFSTETDVPILLDRVNVLINKDSPAISADRMNELRDKTFRPIKLLLEAHLEADRLMNHDMTRCFDAFINQEKNREKHEATLNEFKSLLSNENTLNHYMNVVKMAMEKHASEHSSFRRMVLLPLEEHLKNIDSKLTDSMSFVRATIPILLMPKIEPILAPTVLHEPEMTASPPTRSLLSDAMDARPAEGFQDVEKNTSFTSSDSAATLLSPPPPPPRQELPPFHDNKQETTTVLDEGDLTIPSNNKSPITVRPVNDYHPPYSRGDILRYSSDRMIELSSQISRVPAPDSVQLLSVYESDFLDKFSTLDKGVQLRICDHLDTIFPFKSAALQTSKKWIFGEKESKSDKDVKIKIALTRFNLALVAYQSKDNQNKTEADYQSLIKEFIALYDVVSSRRSAFGFFPSTSEDNLIKFIGSPDQQDLRTTLRIEGTDKRAVESFIGTIKATLPQNRGYGTS